MGRDVGASRVGKFGEGGLAATIWTLWETQTWLSSVEDTAEKYELPSVREPESDKWGDNSGVEGVLE